MSEHLIIFEINLDLIKSDDICFFETPRPSIIDSNTDKRITAITKGIAVYIEEKTSIRMTPKVGYLNIIEKNEYMYGGYLSFEAVDPDSKLFAQELLFDVNTSLKSLQRHLNELKKRDGFDYGSSAISKKNDKHTDKSTYIIKNDLCSYLIIKEIRKQSIRESVSFEMKSGLILDIFPSKSENSINDDERQLVVKVKEVSESNKVAHLVSESDHKVGELHFSLNDTHDLLTARINSQTITITVSTVTNTKNGRTLMAGYQLKSIDEINQRSLIEQ